MQTNIFKDIAISNIAKIVDLLNDGLKPKEQYRLIAIEAYNEYYVLEAMNKVGERIWNIVDYEGLVPKDFCVNWRYFAHILQELKINQK